MPAAPRRLFYKGSVNDFRALFVGFSKSTVVCFTVVFELGISLGATRSSEPWRRPTLASSHNFLVFVLFYCIVFCAINFARNTPTSGVYIEFLSSERFPILVPKPSVCVFARWFVSSTTALWQRQNTLKFAGFPYISQQLPEKRDIEPNNWGAESSRGEHTASTMKSSLAGSPS